MWLTESFLVKHNFVEADFHSEGYFGTKIPNLGHNISRESLFTAIVVIFIAMI